ncbi:major facilitator superfamily domain-containing protein [Fomitopsis serialis]|uniref:major facilitator superfamily domain-containing protein n=1 Tax=Fomitopsis serialis TaxID=139415 RepID=UPI0020087A57|nr:major facilitator superfamily domain-containing protein [Neoantrodia serialis]KAH9924560.1 major facilitator superfamily domain-containing protein [Neoantrodia serialis]
MYNPVLEATRVSSSQSSRDSQSTAVSSGTNVAGVNSDKASSNFAGSATKIVPGGEKPQPAPGHAAKKRYTLQDGRAVLTEREAYDNLGFSFPTWKKWSILSVIFAIQVSMNLNASLYANAAPLLSNHFHISEQAARVGQMIFLVAYAFGSELWAPWSEELGRWPILQLSLCLVNIWQIPCALAPNYGTIVVARFLGGISSAGGSVTLGMVADMWTAQEQQFAVAFIVFSSVGGSVIGPIFGGLIEANLSWHWNFWIQLIAGGVVQAVHFFFVPETCAKVLLDREAKRRRRAGEEVVYGPSEVEENRFAPRKILTIWIRPFHMFLCEPIVLFLSLLSGFSDALIFTFLESFGPVFRQWGFTTETMGAAFVAIAVGYFIAYASFIPWIWKQRNQLRKDPHSLQPEARLWWLLFTVPLEPIGLFGFAWTSFGPPHVPWIAPMIFAAMIAIANFAIYMATIDYMIEAYGPYAASATGGNGFARDFLAGIAALYSVPLYTNLGPHSLEWASTLLGFLAILVAIPVYIFYWKGPEIRARSRFAQELVRREEREEKEATEEGAAGMGGVRTGIV